MDRRRRGWAGWARLEGADFSFSGGIGLTRVLINVCVFHGGLLVVISRLQRRCRVDERTKWKGVALSFMLN